MSQADRIRSGRDFEKMFSVGKVLKNEGFVLYHSPGNQRSVRIGICVGKSLGSAVVRNRLKRQIREVIRKIDFHCESLDAVLVARKSIVGADFNRIYDAIRLVLSKVCIIS